MVCTKAHSYSPENTLGASALPRSGSRTLGTASQERATWFATQVQPHEPEVRGYLRNRFPSVDVDDVVQESYLKLWRWRRSTRKISSSRAYFFSTARNTALTLIRRRRLYSDTPVSELPSWNVIDQERDAFERIHKIQQLELISGVMDELPGRCREIVGLIALQGLSYQEVAARLSLSESTIRVQTARSVRKIADCLRSRIGEEVTRPSPAVCG